MAETNRKNLEKAEVASEATYERKSKNKEWQKPTLEDVSEKIMAQPYIRFT